MIGNLGFVICYLCLIGLRSTPTPLLLYLMVVAQGTLGYSVTSVMGPIPAEIFEGRHYGSIFGTLMLAAILGGAAGPWITGGIYGNTEQSGRRRGGKAPERKSLTEAAGQSGCAGVKLRQQMAFVGKRQGPGDEERGALCSGSLCGSD